MSNDTYKNKFVTGAALRTYPRQGKSTGQKRFKRLEIRQDGISNCLTTNPDDYLIVIRDVPPGFELPKDGRPQLVDILEKNRDPKYLLSRKRTKKILEMTRRSYEKK